MVDYGRSLKVRNHIRASDAINPRIKIAKQHAESGALKRAENTDGAKVRMTSESALVSRREIANLRMNCLEKVGTIAARAAVIGAMSHEFPPCEVGVV